MKKRIAIPPVWLCWFTCLGCLAAYFWAEGDGLTAALVGLVAVTGLAGYWLGGAVIVAFLGALLTGGLFATKLSELFEPMVGDFFGTSGMLNRILATCIGGVTLGILAMLVFEIVWNRLLGKRGYQGAFNQSFGLLLGAIQGAVLSMMIVGGAIVAEPYARHAARRTEFKMVRDVMEQRTAASIVKIGEASRISPMGPFIHRFNPFDRVPRLRRLREVPVSRSPSVVRG